MLVSFGAQPPVSDLRKLHVFYRKLTRGSSDGSVWSAHLPRYRLEEWSVDGVLLRSLERSAPWFPPGESYGYVDSETPPFPGVRALHVDSTGVLWVVIHVSDTNWRSGLGNATDPYGRTYRGITNNSKYFDTIIEAIDTRTAVLLGTMRIDDAVIGFTADGLLFGYEEAENGEPYIPVWRVNLPSGSGRTGEFR